MLKSRFSNFTRKRIIPLLAKLIWKGDYFPGKTRFFRLITENLVFAPGIARHHTGFNWIIDSMHAQQMFLYSCEPFTSQVMSTICMNSQYFVDIGANRGWYSVLLKSKNPSLKIYAFEPDPSIYSLLFDNLEQFRGVDSSIQTEEIALGSINGGAILSTYLEGNDGMMTLFPQEEMKIESQRDVQVATLDRYFRSDIQIADSSNKFRFLLKIDVEGSELDVVSGGKKFIEALRPIIIMEINLLLLASARTTSAGVFEQMESFGYSGFWLDERGKIVKVKDFNTPPHVKLLGSESGANYIFLPKEFGGISADIEREFLPGFDWIL